MTKEQDEQPGGQVEEVSWLTNEKRFQCFCCYNDVNY